MNSNKANPEVINRLSWLMLARVAFTLILLVATAYVHYQNIDTPDSELLFVFYFLAAFLFSISIFYGVISRRIKRQTLFSYIQFCVDTFIVTLIVYITGGFHSFFSFLYLVVIIYASMICYFKGGVFVATIESAFYAVLLLLEFYGVLPSLGIIVEVTNFDIKVTTVVYKILIITSACYAVAFLSGLLTEQNRKSQIELRDMEDHLKRVEKMAYMGEMAAGLAHEIKNPLASLSGSIQLLKEDMRYDSDHERLMQIILRETERLSTLVTDFLFFAKPPAGKPEKIDLKEAIDEIIDLFEKDSIKSDKIELEKALTQDCLVLIDPTHLSQIIWNLLLNAAEAVGEDGRIIIATTPEKNLKVEIQVCDNGCGMEPDVARSIFNPFFTTKSDGTGLGLSITHRILESYNSRLDVQSAPQKGTIFSFTLDMVSPQN